MKTKTKAPYPEDEQIIGSSQVMEELRELIKETAISDARILITGESGTGKELVARAIHRGSLRAAFPFVTVNCAAIPDTLIESELFGYRKGAFTGALSDHKGKFEAADRGTLFLDEVADLSPGAQAKLLRVIQEKQIEPLGSEQSVSVNVRILASTNKNLAASCAAGRFREDLFYRLNVIPIGLPPLRERRGDIPFLFRHFLSLMKADMELIPEGEAFLSAYRWPGNIRELRNLAERCSVQFSPGEKLGEAALRSLLLEKAPSGIHEEKKRILDLRNALEKGYNEAKELFEQQYLRYQLEKHGGSVSGTAAAAGLTPASLRAKLEKYRIK
ncbi:MAG: sigma-54 dependent transcriptional regulator [Treponema sp.]|jgi:two-component system nitrogen regulation response regulator NtrX|nr:sigma-54 dependent transcriptional regulator [Treponema sp.]